MEYLIVHEGLEALDELVLASLINALLSANTKKENCEGLNRKHTHTHTLMDTDTHIDIENLNATNKDLIRAVSDSENPKLTVSYPAASPARPKEDPVLHGQSYSPSCNKYKNIENVNTVILMPLVAGNGIPKNV